MKVTFLRLGHSNNSSSAHSLLFSDKDVRGKNNESSDFGWSNFICSNKSAKTNYLVSCFLGCLNRSFGLGYVAGAYGKDPYHAILRGLANEVDIAKKHASEKTVKELLGISQFGEASVDHQSSITFPCIRSGERLHFDFAKLFIEEFVNNNWYVYGGNDNSGQSDCPLPTDNPEFVDFAKVWSFLKDEAYGSILCAKDEKTGEFVLSKNGGLIKIKF